MKKSLKRSIGEETLALHLRSYKIEFEREWKFHPTRKWRFDFCIPEKKLAIECEGGIYSGGRHTRPTGYIKDMEKYNAASRMGWTVLRYSPQQIKAGQAILEIMCFLTLPPIIAPK